MARDWKKFLFGARIWQPVTDFWAKTTAWPIVGKYSGFILNREHYDVTFIPINAELEGEPDSTVVPRQVAYDMVERACRRVLLPLCICRVGCRCEDYPMEYGCLFLGEATRDIDPSIGREVSVEEAKAHLDSAIATGLIPQIGRVDPDPVMLGIKDHYHFLTLCLCCPCYCIAMRNMPRWPARVKERMHRLEGLSIEVTDDCDGCGQCVRSCFAGAIQVKEGRARITEACKGCGICASTCDRQAISIRVTDGEKMLSEVFSRIESYSDVTSKDTLVG